MSIHKLVKDVITTHKNKVELIQWSIIAGISSLIYSEYIRNMKQKTIPVRSVHVPEIKTVINLLKTDGHVLNYLSENLIDSMRNNYLISKYIDAPELVLFSDENIEILKTIFDLYISPNISRRIPETLILKFSLNDETQKYFREDHTIDIFDRKDLSVEQFDFIANQSCLQLLMTMPTMKKNLILPEDNAKIHMTKSEILTIDNTNAICPIYLDDGILNSIGIMDLLSFVTSTNVHEFPNTDVAAVKSERGGEIIKYSISTSPFNQVGLTVFEGIESVDTEAK